MTDTERRGVKERLRQVAHQEGSQRKLAKRWLGDADKAPQVSAWCSDKKKSALPGAESLMRLRTRCGVSIDWLLTAPVQPDVDDWTPDRLAKLADDLNDYGMHLVAAKLDKRQRKGEGRRRGYPRRAHGEAFAYVLSGLHGDFLAFFTAQVETLATTGYPVFDFADLSDAREYRAQEPGKPVPKTGKPRR